MSLNVGIVGLPNSGKSTLFNALLKKQIAQVAEYPYTTIEPNVGVVEVPDERLSRIADVLAGDSIASLQNDNKGRINGRPQVVPAAIKFIDIAGLIKGAHQGEGLGNQFLAHIREVDAILHVVRNFENPEVVHVHGKVDPREDIVAVNAELELADIKKQMIYILNVSEKDLKNGSIVQTIELIKERFKSPAVAICAKLEAELSDLSIDEQKAYLKELGVDKSVLDEVITASFKLLDLITFFTTAGGKMVQAWPIKRGRTMIEAAEKVHTDFARGFIAAETVDWQKLVDCGSRHEGRGSLASLRSGPGAAWHDAKERGYVHTAGRDEEVKDGEVIEFKFKV